MPGEGKMNKNWEEHGLCEYGHWAQNDDDF